MNINEVAKNVGISDKTLRSWEKEFGIEVKRGDRNHRRYDENIVEIFKKIKNLKDGKRSNDTIRMVVGTSWKGTKTDSESTWREPVVNVENIREVMKIEIDEAFIKNNELSEKYAMAAHKIGELESDIKHLEEKVKLLPDPMEYEKIKNENIQLKQGFEGLTKENEFLRLPWYKKLFTR
jgi:DNA-binding transcriptional MerR regulator